MKAGYKVIWISLVLLFAFGSSLAAAVSSGADFLLLPVNARQLTTGNMANTEGVDGMVFNPAATSVFDNYRYEWQASGSFHQLVESVTYANLNFSMPVSRRIGAFGAGLIYVNYGTIDNVDQDGNDIGTFSAGDYSAYLNYSREIFYGIIAGINLKFIYQQIESFSANAVASDVGLKRLFQLGRHRFWLGAHANNLGTVLSFIDQGTPLPRIYGASGSYSLYQYLPRYLDINLGPEFRYQADETLVAGVGTEARFGYGRATAFLRARYYLGTLDDSWSVGGGLSYNFSQEYNTDLSAGVSPSSAFSSTYLLSAKVTRLKPSSNKLGKSRFQPVETRSDQEIVAETQNFLKQYEGDAPGDLAALGEAMQKKGLGRPEVISGELYYLPHIKKVLYRSDTDKVERPHSLYMVEGTQFNGTVIAQEDNEIKVETSFGLRVIPADRIIRAIDRQITPAESEDEEDYIEPENTNGIDGL